MWECEKTMPAIKPLILHSETDRHKTRKEARSAAEDAVTLQQELSIHPPKELKDYPVAQECWRFHVRLYKKLAGKIATPFDQHILIEYCLGWAYLAELRILRKLALEKKRFELYVSLDQRVDRKGARLDTLRQQLYLTPRSRAGVAPIEKEKEEEDGMDRLLKEIEKGYSWDEVVNMNSRRSDNG
jgi:phage terminase small subunit